MARTKKEAPQASTTEYIDDSDAKNEPKVEIVASPSPESTKNDIKSAEEGVAELKRKLEESETARSKAERERNEAVQRAYTANNEKEDTNLRLIESAIGQVAANSTMLEQAYSDALIAGDTTRAAKIMREMAANEAKALQLQNGKQSLQESPRGPQRPLDPVEAFASQLSPKSAAWVRAHPEYATNPKLTQKMIAAHNMAVADGFAADTDDYFESVEEALKINRRAPAPARDDDWSGEQFSDASRGQGGRQVAPSAIPVSRDVSPSGRSTRAVRLTKDEVEIAELTGQTPEQYYRNKMRDERERMN
jgi:hypothetical protein